jgi:hypothetical protein
MATVSLLAIHVLGKGLLGLAAAIIAGIAVYAPVVYPMRSLLRRTPAPADELHEVSADDPIDHTRRTGAAAGGPGP